MSHKRVLRGGAFCAVSRYRPYYTYDVSFSLCIILSNKTEMKNERKRK